MEVSNWVSVEGAFEGRRGRRKRRRRKREAMEREDVQRIGMLGDVFQVLGDGGRSARVRPKLG